MQESFAIRAGLPLWAVSDGPGSLRRDSNRHLGELRISMLDRDDNIAFDVREYAVSGGRIGARRGYETVAEALRVLGRRTTGDVPAAAIIERDGAFYGHVLKGRSMDQAHAIALLRPLHLETTPSTTVTALAATGRFDRLVALVDGGWHHDFRS